MLAQTQTQRDGDAASVATTSSLSSRLTLIKDKFHHESAFIAASKSSKDNKEREDRERKDSVLRNQIRIGV